MANRHLDTLRVSNIVGVSPSAFQAPDPLGSIMVTNDHTAKPLVLVLPRYKHLEALETPAGVGQFKLGLLEELISLVDIDEEWLGGFRNLEHVAVPHFFSRFFIVQICGEGVVVLEPQPQIFAFLSRVVENLLVQDGLSLVRAYFTGACVGG